MENALGSIHQGANPFGMEKITKQWVKERRNVFGMKRRR
jgi:hypothetical protein